MSRKIINPDWKKAREEEIRKGEFASVTVDFNLAAQWLIARLDNAGIPFRVINLGAGVKKIIKDDGVCPHCHQKLKGGIG